MVEKIPISFNQDNLDAMSKLENYIFGDQKIYGSTPKVIKFSINFLLSHIENQGKVERSLNEEELDWLATSEKRFELKRRLQEQAHNLQDQAKKV